MMPTHYIGAALSWVNYLRQHMGNRPIQDFPAAIPGDGENCMIARAIKMHTSNVDLVQISGNSWHVRWHHKEVRLEAPMFPVIMHPNDCIKAESLHTVTVPRHKEEQGELPYECKKLIRAFDSGDPKLDHYKSGEMPPARSEGMADLMNKAAQSSLQVLTAHDFINKADEKPLTATEIQASMEEVFKSLYPVPPMPALNFLPELPKFVKTPDWAKLSEIPEAPVKVLEEEPITV